MHSGLKALLYSHPLVILAFSTQNASLTAGLIKSGNVECTYCMLHVIDVKDYSKVL